MSRNDSSFFYQELGALTASYVDNLFELSARFNNLKIECLVGDLEFKLNGIKDGVGISDGLIRPTDGIVTFKGLNFGRIAVRGGSVTGARIWAY